MDLGQQPWWEGCLSPKPAASEKTCVGSPAVPKPCPYPSSGRSVCSAFNAACILAPDLFNLNLHDLPNKLHVVNQFHIPSLAAYPIGTSAFCR